MTFQYLPTINGKLSAQFHVGRSRLIEMMAFMFFFNFLLKQLIKFVLNKKGDIGMSSADPPDWFDRSAGAAYVNQPCGENFLSLACDHDGENTQVGVLISNSY